MRIRISLCFIKDASVKRYNVWKTATSTEIRNVQLTKCGLQTNAPGISFASKVRFSNSDALPVFFSTSIGRSVISN